MKSLKELKIEIDEILTLQMKKMEEKDYKKAVRRLEFLKVCLRYIESGATEEFVNKEIERLTNRIGAFRDNYDTWLGFTDTDSIKGNKLTFYEKEMGVPKLRKQISSLRFILK